MSYFDYMQLGTDLKDHLVLDGWAQGNANTSGVDIDFDESSRFIGRASGSFVTDGWAAGMLVTVSGSTSNDGTYPIKTASSNILTLQEGVSLTDEGPAAGITLDNGSPADDTEDIWQLIAEELSLAHNDQAWQQPVLSAGDETPPGSPSVGDRYIIGTSPTGDWSTHANDIAECTDDSPVTWIFTDPFEGMTAWVSDDNDYWHYQDGSWVPGGLGLSQYWKLAGRPGGQTGYGGTGAGEIASLSGTSNQSKGYVRIGTSGIPLSLTKSDGAFFVTGESEFHDTLWLDGSPGFVAANWCRFGDNAALSFGAPDASLQWVTTANPDAVVLGLGSQSRILYICEEADKATVWNKVQQVDPTLVLQSADATALTDRLWMQHNQSAGVIGTDADGIRLEPYTGTVEIDDGTADPILALTEGGTQRATLTYARTGNLLTLASLEAGSHIVFDPAGGEVRLGDDDMLRWGNPAVDSSYLEFETDRATSQDAMLWVLPISNTVHLADKDFLGWTYGTNHGDPTIVLHGATNTATHYGILSYYEAHPTRARLTVQTGFGDIEIKPASKIELTPGDGEVRLTASNNFGSLGFYDGADKANLSWNKYQTNDCLYISVDATSKNLIIADHGNWGTDFAYATNTDPRVYLKATGTTAKEAGAFFHDGAGLDIANLVDTGTNPYSGHITLGLGTSSSILNIGGRAFCAAGTHFSRPLRRCFIGAQQASPYYSFYGAGIFSLQAPNNSRTYGSTNYGRVAQYNTSATTGNYAGIYLQDQAQWRMRPMYFACRIAKPTTSGYRVWAGIIEDFTTAGGNNDLSVLGLEGFGFRAAYLTDTYWTFCGSDGSSQSTVVSSLAVGTGVTDIEIVVWDEGWSSSSETAYAWINGTYVGAITKNLTETVELDAGVIIEKISGVVSVQINIVYIGFVSY